MLTNTSIQIQPLALENFTARLKSRNPFAFVRYGDGEFNAILGVRGHNCDGHEYFEDLGDALAETLKHPRGGDYVYAIGPKAAKGMNVPVTRWLSRNAPKVEWRDSEVLLTASLAGELFPLVRVLNHRRVVIVGAAHLTQLWEQGLLREPQAHVMVPNINAWLDQRRIAQDILRAVNPANAARRADVVLFSAGMTSKVLIWSLFPILGETTSLLDTGSLFDFYCGKDSRSYARRMTLERKRELAIVNFGLTRIVKVQIQ